MEKKNYQNFCRMHIGSSSSIRSASDTWQICLNTVVGLGIYTSKNKLHQIVPQWGPHLELSEIIVKVVIDWKELWFMVWLYNTSEESFSV